MLAERGVNADHSTIYRGFSVMRLKWKNGCVGTGVKRTINFNRYVNFRSQRTLS